MSTVIALSMSFSPTLFPRASAAADYAEANIQAVFKPQQDVPPGIHLESTDLQGVWSGER